MFHGGDLHQASKLYGQPLTHWLDLSTGINPMPYPAGEIERDLWHRLPSPTALKDLEALARIYYNVHPDAEIMAAGGSSALIAALPSLKAHSHCAIIKHSYQEHLNAWSDRGSYQGKQAGSKVSLLEETSLSESTSLTQAQVASPPILPPSTNVCILVNPNNPTGRRYAPQALLALRQTLGQDGLLIVDEAFMDCSPDYSLAPLAGQKGLIILRSFGKFFGLAGLRLGFAIGHPDDIAHLRRKLGAWPISGAAIAIASKALQDDQWIDQTKTALSTSSAALHQLLKDHNFDIIGGTDLFTLIRNDNIENIQSKLAQHAIWTRIFDYQPGWMRLGLPTPDNGFKALSSALSHL